MNKKKSSQSGVALLMSLGMLALLSVLGAAFAINMRLLERTTRDFIYEVQARYLAEGGIESAIAQLKNDARNRFDYNSNVVIADQAGLLDGHGSVKNVTIIDTARQVNINNANADLLDCLPGIGKGVDSKGQAIINARNVVPFITKKSVCLASDVGSSTYDSIKNLISINTYIDPNVQDNTGASRSRSAINLNTVDRHLLEDIIAKVDSTNASTIATNIVSVRPVNSWAEFNNITGMTDSVKEAFNPNRKKSSSYYSTFPTEFCFHSGGIYELTATGEVTRGGQIVASKQISATVRIFDLHNITTSAQFQGDIKIDSDVNNDGINESSFNIDFDGDGVRDDDVPDYGRVTWLDNCPLNMDECYNQYYNAGGAVIEPKNSLKMGFWDDFSNQSYSYSQWRVYIGGAAEGALLGGDYLLHGGGYINCTGHVSPFSSQPNVCLVEPDVTDITNAKRWNWWDHSIWVSIFDNMDPRSSMVPTGSDVPRICIKNDLGFIDSSVFHLRPQKHAINKYQYDGIRDPITGKDHEPDPYHPGGDPLPAGVSSKGEPGKPPYFQFWASETSGVPSGGKVSVKPHPSDNYAVFERDIWEVYKITSTSNSTSASIYYTGTFHVERDLPLYWAGKGKQPFTATGSFPSATSAQNVFGILKLYAPTIKERNGLRAKNIRVIGRNGFYESLPITIDENRDGTNDRIELGSVWGTKTIPKNFAGTGNAADPDKNKIAFQVNVDDGTWYPDVEDTGTVKDNVPDCSNIEAELISTTGIYPETRPSITGTSIKTKAVFTTADADFSETPVLEDIWVTYLPKTRILYWRE